jgi:hypothetical protein
VVGALAATLLLGGVAILVVATTRPRSSTVTAPVVSPTLAVVTPTTLVVLGSLVLIDPEEGWRVGRSCEGAGGYHDIYAGAQVSVYDPAGRVVGLARLVGGEGLRGPSSVVCAFTFAVSVPAGLGFYSFEVTHRGKVTFPESELSDPLDGPSLSLGSDS